MRSTLKRPSFSPIAARRAGYRRSFILSQKRPIGAVTEDGPMERKRLVADRLPRIWHIGEDIAETPGKSRRELADKFHLIEGQVQADLNIIRTARGLPLVRLQG